MKRVHTVSKPDLSLRGCQAILLDTHRFDIKPVAKQRPRKGKHGNLYTPSETRAFEMMVSMIGNQLKKKMYECAIVVDCWFYLKKPKSVKRKFPTVKPDYGNFGKSFIDGLNKVFWHDDCIIISGRSTKFYSKSEPYIDVEIYELK